MYQSNSYTAMLLITKWLDINCLGSLRSIYVGENLTFPDTFKANQFVRYVFSTLYLSEG